MCHKETKALISLRTRVHVPLLTPWEASAHTKTSLSTQHKLLLRDGATFQFLTVGTGNTGRKKKKKRTSKRTEIFSCCFWVLVFFLVTGDVQCLCSSPVEKKTFTYQSWLLHLRLHLYWQNFRLFLYPLWHKSDVLRADYAEKETSRRLTFLSSQSQIDQVCHRGGMKTGFLCKGSFNLCILWKEKNWT